MQKYLKPDKKSTFCRVYKKGSGESSCVARCVKMCQLSEGSELKPRINLLCFDKVTAKFSIG